MNDRISRGASGEGGQTPSVLPDPSDYLAHAFGPPPLRGRIRVAPADFVVGEVLGFVPDGEGDHAFVRVRKRDANTEWVARRLAAFAAVPPNDVGYAGLKDRAAVTEQWFSVLLPGKPDPDWSALDVPGVTVVEATRNRRKLRRGVLRGNRFRLVVRELAQGDGGPVDRADLEARLERIAGAGVPNYFGPQRFGIDGGNLARAGELFSGARTERDRHLRGLYYSAVRSYLFNRVLSHRVRAGVWHRAIPGDAMNLDGSRSFFVADAVDAEIERRLGDLDIHPTGPLWGAGDLATRGEARRFEEEVLAPMGFWRQGLEAAGLKHERRALRLPVRELAWEWLDAVSLALAFALPAGAYATTVLREAVEATSSTGPEGGEGSQ